MKKTKLPKRSLRLEKETLVELTIPDLTGVAGGNNSHIASQCKTLCFTLGARVTTI